MKKIHTFIMPGALLLEALSLWLLLHSMIQTCFSLFLPAVIRLYAYQQHSIQRLQQYRRHRIYVSGSKNGKIYAKQSSVQKYYDYLYYRNRAFLCQLRFRHIHYSYVYQWILPGYFFMRSNHSSNYYYPRPVVS